MTLPELKECINNIIKYTSSHQELYIQYSRYLIKITYKTAQGKDLLLPNQRHPTRVGDPRKASTCAEEDVGNKDSYLCFISYLNPINGQIM